MDNLKIFNKTREVPQDCLKEIKGGRLNGMTDINPMWRIEKLTEIFGVCGFGWYFEITKQWSELGSDGVISTFMNINLFIKDPDTQEWSKPIQGTGGSSFVSKEKNGLYTSDECYKMALTDAISVACKSLGFGANVYYGQINTKYTKPGRGSDGEPKCVECLKPFKTFTTKAGKTYSPEQMEQFAKNKNKDSKPRCQNCAIKTNQLIEN